MKICIIGSGLSALTLAKTLVNLKINVDMVYPNKNYKISRSRTIGISKSNYEYFNSNIINIDKIIWKLKKIEIFSENLKNEKLLNFTNNNEQLFSIIKNSKLYELLDKSLSSNKFFKKEKFAKNFLFLKNYDLIVNTDYSNYLTKKFFNRKIIKLYNSFAHTTLIKHKKISNNVATQIFTKKGPLAFLPISNNKTSIVFSINYFRNTKINNFENLIQKYNSKYKIEKIEKIESFELKSLNLRNYYINNILAFGDLLHRIHPLAGQGFNMTIRDTRVFTDIVKEKINLGLPLDSSVNKEFEKRVRHKNYIFTNSIDFIHEFFNLERKLNTSILSRSVKILGDNPSINKMFTKIADKGIFNY